MTRLGPLTSQALGRSPYDIVVYGDGYDIDENDNDEHDENEHDAHDQGRRRAATRGYQQQYDERGRPVNEDTKRINRDIVRSHNEVMQVIGVAEPEMNSMAANIQHGELTNQQLYENRVGRRLWPHLHTAGLVGLWATESLRHRALLFRRFDTYPPWHGFASDYGLQTLGRLMVGGLPLAMLERRLVRAWIDRGNLLGPWWVWKQALFGLFRAHLRAFVWMQRMAIVPADEFWPSLLYFVPFSSQSPIQRPPPLPTDLTWASLGTWAGQAVLRVAPVLLLWAYTEACEWLDHRVDLGIYHHVAPTTKNWPIHDAQVYWNPYTGERHLAGLPPPEMPIARPIAPPSERPSEQAMPSRNAYVPTLTADDDDDAQRRARSPTPSPPARSRHGSPPPVASPPGPDTVESSESRAAESRAAELFDLEAQFGDQQLRSGTPGPSSPTLGHRHNTLSSAGGDDAYISDEEEFEVSTTHISFDVEAHDAGDHPPNAWSAELRQNSSPDGFDDDDGDASRDAPGARGRYSRGVFLPEPNTSFYSDTMLSRLPVAVYASSAGSLTAMLICIDVEALVLRLLARSFRIRRHLPVDDLHGLPWVPFLKTGLSLDGTCHLALSILLQSLFNHACISTATWLACLYHGSYMRHGFFETLRAKYWPTDEDKKRQPPRPLPELSAL